MNSWVMVEVLLSVVKLSSTGGELIIAISFESSQSDHACPSLTLTEASQVCPFSVCDDARVEVVTAGYSTPPSDHLISTASSLSPASVSLLSQDTARSVVVLAVAGLMLTKVMVGGVFNEPTVTVAVVNHVLVSNPSLAVISACQTSPE